MKKISTLLMLFAVAMLPLAFSSCEDQEIGSTLEGTWEGYTSIYSDYDGRKYESTTTRLYFETDVFKFKEGGGYWVDFYREHPWDRDCNYVASSIRWRVSNGVIRIHFREDNYDIEIRDYHLNDNHFVGNIYTEDGKIIEFNFIHISSPNWDRDDYEYNGYGHYGYDYGYGYDYYGYGAKGAPGSEAQQGEVKRMKRVFIPNK